MRAAVNRGARTIAVEERALPELGPRDALIEVSHCGICGTDLHMVMEGWARPESIGGHEYAGRIAALGSEVSDWTVGERVVGGPEPGCGACEPCRAHRPGLCVELPTFAGREWQGAFAQYTRVDASQLVRLPDEMGVREAALCEPLAVALHAITLSGISAEDGGASPPRVLVSGTGPIGALTLAALAARGVNDLTVSEPSPTRRELALRLGARRAVAPDAFSVPRLAFELVDEPFDVVFECSGAAAAVETGLGQLGRMGRLLLVGTGMKRPRLDLNRVLLNELVVIGSYNYDEHGFRDALALLASGRLPFDALIEPDDVALEDMLPAMERLSAGAIGGKVLVAPNGRRSDQ